MNRETGRDSTMNVIVEHFCTIFTFCHQMLVLFCAYTFWFQMLVQLDYLLHFPGWVALHIVQLYAHFYHLSEVPGGNSYYFDFRVIYSTEV